MTSEPIFKGVVQRPISGRIYRYTGHITFEDGHKIQSYPYKTEKSLKGWFDKMFRVFSDKYTILEYPVEVESIGDEQ